VASCCKCGDEPSGSCATELDSYCRRLVPLAVECGKNDVDL
jgi:hypothetical protein